MHERASKEETTSCDLCTFLEIRQLVQAHKHDVLEMDDKGSEHALARDTVAHDSECLKRVDQISLRHM